MLLPPPPIESEQWIRSHPGRFGERIEVNGINDPEYRLGYWESQREYIREEAKRRGYSVVELPEDIFSREGYLREAYRNTDPSHGNLDYGQSLLQHLADWSRDLIGSGATKTQSRAQQGEQPRHPYLNRPWYTYWRQGVAEIPAGSLDPVVAPPFTITHHTRIAAAGSCFAQHIARRLLLDEFNLMRLEDASSASGEVARFI